jgi:hypothetical protein
MTFADKSALLKKLRPRPILLYYKALPVIIITLTYDMLPRLSFSINSAILLKTTLKDLNTNVQSWTNRTL